MASKIDSTVPPYGSALTEAVRTNFLAAHDEISTLQIGTLPLDGGQMNGPIVLPADPIIPLHAATKQYIDTKIGSGGVQSFNARIGAVTFTQADALAVNCMLSTGANMSGALILNADPTTSLQAATKAYVDANISGGSAGVASFNTRTGAVTFLTADVTGAGGMLAAGGAFSGGVNFGSTFASNNGDSARHISLYGGNQYGLNATNQRMNLNVPSASVVAIRVGNADAVTVDANGVNLPANPTTNLQATTKQYTDTAVATKAPVVNPVFTNGVFETRVAMPANAIDLNTGSLFTKTIAGATTLTISNAPGAGTLATFMLELTNGGSAAITWFAGVTWAAGTAPSLTAAGVDILGFYSHNGGTQWRGMLLAKDVR